VAELSFKDSMLQCVLITFFMGQTRQKCHLPRWGTGKKESQVAWEWWGQLWSNQVAEPLRHPSGGDQQKDGIQICNLRGSSCGHFSVEVMSIQGTAKTGQVANVEWKKGQGMKSGDPKDVSTSYIFTHGRESHKRLWQGSACALSQLLPRGSVTRTE
jgi:hypothetical protein